MAVKMEAARSSEMFVYCSSTARSHNPNDLDLENAFYQGSICKTRELTVIIVLRLQKDTKSY